MTAPDLICPVCCDGPLKPILEYRSMSYSDHRDWTGTECSECGQEWNTDGSPRSL